MDPIRKAGFTLFGIKLDKKTTNEGGQSGIDCGSLWQKFEKGNYNGRTPNKLSEEVYAVYYDYEGDHTKPFSYFIGSMVDENAVLPEGMDFLRVPKNQYSSVMARGQMPDCIANAWKGIWESTIVRAYSYDFEIYDHRSVDWNNAEVEIFISVL